MDEAVGPLAVIAGGWVESVTENDDVGDGQQEDAGDLEDSFTAERYEKRDDDVELLFDGDAPEWIDRAGDPSVAKDVSVTDEEREGQP